MLGFLSFVLILSFINWRGAAPLPLGPIKLKSRGNHPLNYLPVVYYIGGGRYSELGGGALDIILYQIPVIISIGMALEGEHVPLVPPCFRHPCINNNDS